MAAMVSRETGSGGSGSESYKVYQIPSQQAQFVAGLMKIR